MIMCNAILLGMITAMAFELGLDGNIGFWIAYIAAIVTNTIWFKRKEEKWLRQPAEMPREG